MARKTADFDERKNQSRERWRERQLIATKLRTVVCCQWKSDEHDGEEAIAVGEVDVVATIS
jgi:hypothetical protein